VRILRSLRLLPASPSSRSAIATDVAGFNVRFKRTADALGVTAKAASKFYLGALPSALAKGVRAACLLDEAILIDLAALFRATLNVAKQHDQCRNMGWAPAGESTSRMNHGKIQATSIKRTQAQPPKHPFRSTPAPVALPAASAALMTPARPVILAAAVPVLQTPSTPFRPKHLSQEEKERRKSIDACLY
jgi:hypothetical protein